MCYDGKNVRASELKAYCDLFDIKLLKIEIAAVFDAVAVYNNS